LEELPTGGAVDPDDESELGAVEAEFEAALLSPP
jgi:hypothetical protein